MIETGRDGNSGGGRVGQTLREAREARGITLQSVAELTRIPIRHLEAIENGSHEGLPAIPYSAGFVKVYANAIGLNGGDCSRRFRDEAGAVHRVRYEPAPYEPADPARVPSRLIAIVGVVVAVLLALGYLLWRGGPSHDAVMQQAATPDVPAVAPPAAAPAPAIVVTPPPAPAPVTTGPVALVADRPVWMKVYEKGGRTLFIGMLNPGQRYDVPTTAIDPRLQTGRANGLQVTVGGQPIPALGREAEVVRNVSLLPAALVAYRAAHPDGPDGAAVPGAVPPPLPAGPTPPTLEIPGVTPPR